MKLYLLVTLVMWAVSGEAPTPPDYQLFSSPENAAIYVYQDHDPKAPPLIPGGPKPKERFLYEVNLQTQTMREVSIPSLTFIDGGFHPHGLKRK
jgi:hypothetical protein